jgi:hypothetical protein
MDSLSYPYGRYELRNIFHCKPLSIMACLEPNPARFVEPAWRRLRIKFQGVVYEALDDRASPACAAG